MQPAYSAMKKTKLLGFARSLANLQKDKRNFQTLKQSRRIPGLNDSTSQWTWLYPSSAEEMMVQSQSQLETRGQVLTLLRLLPEYAYRISAAEPALEDKLKLPSVGLEISPNRVTYRSNQKHHPAVDPLSKVLKFLIPHRSSRSPYRPPRPDAQSSTCVSRGPCNPSA